MSGDGVAIITAASSDSVGYGLWGGKKTQTVVIFDRSVLYVQVIRLMREGRGLPIGAGYVV